MDIFFRDIKVEHKDNTNFCNIIILKTEVEIIYCNLKIIFFPTNGVIKTPPNQKRNNEWAVLMGFFYKYYFLIVQ